MSQLEQLALFLLPSSALLFCACATVLGYSFIVIHCGILDKVKQSGAFFIGMGDHKIEGVWKTTESGYTCDLQFSKWTPGEPNNENNEDCAIIISWTGKWADRPCNMPFHFVCQLP